MILLWIAVDDVDDVGENDEIKPGFYVFSDPSYRI